LHRFDPRIAGASVLAIVGDGWRIGGMPDHSQQAAAGYYPRPAQIQLAIT
jgi:hypothetical protein